MLAIPYHPIQNLLFESRRWFKWSMFCCNCYLFEVMGLYWSCDWFATFSTLRVQGAFLWGDGWWLEMIWWTKRWVGWDFCSINLNQPGNDNFSISLILTPTRIGGGVPTGIPMAGCCFRCCFNLSEIHPWLSTGAVVVGIYTYSTFSHTLWDANAGIG